MKIRLIPGKILLSLLKIKARFSILFKLWKKFFIYIKMIDIKKPNKEKSRIEIIIEKTDENFKKKKKSIKYYI